MDSQIVSTVVVGCGRMARSHVKTMLKQPETTHIMALSEPSPEAYQAMADVFSAAGQSPPPNQPNLQRLLDDFGAQLDTAFIVTPHAYHYEQTALCLEAGLDVLLEKPMVVTADEARRLVAIRDRTRRQLVVAFNGSLSPRIRRVATMLRAGELGELLSIVATVWENWAPRYRGHWKQDYAISGGGFMFDTGAHMLNTVADLAGEDFVELAAWLDKRSSPVDVVGTVMARLASGVQISLHACGETIPSCASDVRLFCTGAIVRTGVWGEFLEIQRAGESSPTCIEMAHVPTPWEQFLAVRRGEIDNPAPPEVGLRMAKLWDAIQLSAGKAGQLVPVT